MSNKSLKIVALGITGLLLNACGESSNPNEITFWNVFTGPDGENMQTMVDEYNETDPEYPINNISMGADDMYSRIPTVVNSGSGIPDLNIVHAERVIQFRDAGLLTSYDDYLDDYNELITENYVPEAWEIGSIDDERWGIPLDIHAYVMYYNPSLVEKYAPQALDDNIITYDEIIEIAELAEEDGVSSVGLTWMRPSFLSVFDQYGGELSEDGHSPTLDTQATIDTFNHYINLYENGITNEEGSDTLELFLNNKLVFWPEGIWMQNELNNAEFDYGMVHFPQLSDDISETVNWASSHQFVMFNSDERDDEKTQGAIDFIDWVRDNSLEWAKAGQVPATLLLLEEDEYLEMPQSVLVETEENQHTMKIFDYKYYGYVSEWLDANVFDVIFGRIDPEEAAASFQQEVQDKIDQDSTGLESPQEDNEEEANTEDEE